MKIPM